MDLVNAPRRFEVYLVKLDPTIGSEIQKTRPCIIVSPDDLNRALRTVIVTPMTSTRWDAPFRVPVRFDNRDGSIALDQVRTVDRQRLIRRLGTLDLPTSEAVAIKLIAMFTL